MHDAEWRRIAAQRGQPVQQGMVGRARQQRGEQRIFLRAGGIDLVYIAGTRILLAEEIGAQHAAIDPGRGLDRCHALRRYARPVGDRRLGDANFSGKRTDAAGGTYCFVEARIAHGTSFSLFQFNSRSLLPRSSMGQ
jgi:hypothetical protein